MDLPVELKSLRKGLINIKHKYEKCFLWAHVSHINPYKEHPERVKKTDKTIAEKLDYHKIEFLMQEKDFNKIEVNKMYAVTCLVMKISWFFQFIFPIKNLKAQ